MPKNIQTNKWYKFDFHLHTSASLDYREQSDFTPEEWLKTAMQAKLDCVAITDHNTGEWVDILKSTYDSIRDEEWFRPLVIFPGVEITISTGSSRIHMLAIFDPKKSTQDITRFLGSCNLQGVFGDPENAYTTLSIDSVVKKISEANGIAVPAHIDIKRGLLDDVTTTNPDLKKHLSLFDGAQFIDKNYFSRTNLHTELKGDAQHLAIVCGSDAHCLADIGSNFSWVKMGSPTISGLNFALKDHQFGILNQVVDPNSLPRSYIKNMKIKGMKHCGMFPNNTPEFQLHPLFNAIIGGRGTGKSTFIESLRLVLGRTEDLAEHPNLHAEIASFVDGVTTEQTLIEAEFKKNSSSYIAQWKKDEATSFKRSNGEGWDKDNGDIRDRFSVNIYSQKQINALALNSTGLMELVDRSVDFQNWSESYEQEKQRYLDLSSDENILIKSISSEGSKRSRLKELDSDINGFESGGHSQVLSFNQMIVSIERELEKACEIRKLENGLNELLEFSIPTLDLGILDENEAELRHELSEIQDNFEGELQIITKQFSALKENLNQAVSRRSEAICNSRWSQRKELSAQQYQSLVNDYLERGAEFNTKEYESWIDQKIKIESQLDTIQQEKAKLDETISAKQVCINNLLKMRAELLSKRQEFLNSILNGNQYVKMSIKPFSDTSKLEKTVRDFLGHEKFASSIYEKDNTSSLLYGLFHAERTVESRVKAHHIFISTMKSLVQGIVPEGYKINNKLVNFLKERYEREPEFIARLASWMPDDLLEVQYSPLGDGREFTSLSKGSAGQKAAAILAFLLSHGEEPIIIDQPEDDLDNALVYRLVVNQIRLNKTRRQIIIVTHNPNIVVNGDAEQVNVMEFRGGQVQIKATGSLIEQNIRDEVCEIMEGGEEAFNKRFYRITRL